jgi:hypothetical protein
VLGVDDISGAKSKGVYLRTNSEYDSLNYKDVTKPHFKTTRSVNPLKPEYVIRDELNKAVTIGDVDGSAPAKIKERKRGLLNGCLEVADIQGSAAGSRRLGAFHSTSRRQFLNPNDISDIGGSQPDTLKRGV